MRRGLCHAALLHHAPASIILPDIPVGLVEQFLVGVQLEFEEGATQRLFHFAFALGGGLPAIEAHLLHDGVDVGHDALDDDVRVLALHFVEEFGQGGQSAVLLFFGLDLLFGFHGFLGEFEDAFESPADR